MLLARKIFRVSSTKLIFGGTTMGLIGIIGGIAIIIIVIMMFMFMGSKGVGSFIGGIFGAFKK
jgi:hypothetical protein